MKSAEDVILESARKIVPDWMSPLHDARYRDVKRELLKIQISGMKKAAEICVKNYEDPAWLPDYRMASHNCAASILSAITELEK